MTVNSKKPQIPVFTRTSFADFTDKKIWKKRPERTPSTQRKRRAIRQWS